MCLHGKPIRSRTKTGEPRPEQSVATSKGGPEVIATTGSAATGGPEVKTTAGSAATEKAKAVNEDAPAIPKETVLEGRTSSAAEQNQWLIGNVIR